MYRENEPVMKRNEVILIDLPSNLSIIEADDKFLHNYKYLLATNQKQKNTGGLANMLT